MTYKDIHNTFRTLGQQMGMQKNRTILPDSINVYINGAILEKTKEELAKAVSSNVQVSADLQVPNMSLINTLGNLFRSKQITEDNDLDLSDVMFILGASIKYDKPKDKSFRCRIVAFDVIDDISSDYCNKPSKEYPVICYCDNKLNVYNDNTNYSFINLKYLKHPSKIVCNENTDNWNTEYVDFQDDFMYEIIELAVQKYLISVYGRPTSNDGNKQQTN